MLHDLNETKHDSLAIVVSGLHIEKLLDISLLPVGNGTLMS